MTSIKDTRLFCITNYHDLETADDHYKQVIQDKTAAYIAYGAETCPTTGRPHHQMWVYFKNQRSTGKRALKKIGELITRAPSHVEPMKGSITDNVKYCEKEGSYITHGKKPEQGHRTDLDEMVTDIKSGKRKAENILLSDPIKYHQYGRTLEKVEDIVLRKKFRTEQTACIWYWGPTGVGKSHHAFRNFDPDECYTKCLTDQWWDGYTGQRKVILNEFSGEISFKEFLALVDKWPHYVKRRNREPTPFLAEIVYVTSSKRPREIFGSVGEDLAQLDRRIETVHIRRKHDSGLVTPRMDDDESVASLPQKCSEGNTKDL